MLLGAISFSDTVDAGMFAKELAARSCRIGMLRADSVARSAKFACFRLHNGKQVSQFAHAEPAAGQLVAISGNIPCPQKEIESTVQAPEPLWERLPGHWVGVHYNQATHSLRIGNDVLGVGWTFVAKMPWGYAFGPDFGALASMLQGNVELDYEHMLITLAVGYALDDSTCFQNIRLLPAGATFHCNADAVSISSRQVCYGEQHRDSYVERMRRFGDILDQAAATWIRSTPHDLDISLSAGLDCRYGLGLMLEAGSQPRAYTFGHSSSGEVRGAKRVARSASLTTSVYDPGRTHWEGWRLCVEQTGALGGFHWPDWLGWLEYLGARSNRVLIGFMGDAVSGKHLLPARGDSVESHRDAWSRGNVDWNWTESSILTPKARRDSTDVVEGAIRSMLDPVQFAHGHQAQLHLDWYGRQRRFTGAQPNLMQNVIGVVPFLYEPHMLEYWSAAPVEDLTEQRLYLDYAARRFPRLFGGSLRGAAFGQRLSGSVRNALASLGPRWKARFAAPVLDPASMIVDQAQNIEAAVVAAEEDLSQILDVAQFCDGVRAFPRSGGLSAMQIRRVANLAILLNTNRGEWQSRVSSEQHPMAAEGARHN